MKKVVKKIILILSTSLMVIAPISSLYVPSNQITITYAAKSTKKSSAKKKSSTKKKGSSSSKKSSISTNKNSNSQKDLSRDTLSSSKTQGNVLANDNTPGVWIPKTGKKYHSKSSCSRMKNPRKVSLEEAKRLGYDPCSKCMY